MTSLTSDYELVAAAAFELGVLLKCTMVLSAAGIGTHKPFIPFLQYDSVRDASIFFPGFLAARMEPTVEILLVTLQSRSFNNDMLAVAPAVVAQ
jgi:hypothetical protein